jgi:hypothetical protein
MSLLNYFILLLSTVAWIIVMFLPICEFIQVKMLCIIIRKYFRVNSCQFKVDYLSISFCTFCITLRNLKIWIENVGYVEFEEIKIRLNDLKMWKNKGSSVSKRAFCVKFTRTTFHLFQENFMEILSFYQNALSLLELSFLKDCFFDMDKIVLFFNSTSRNNSSLVIEIDRSTFAYEQFVINDSNASNILLDRLNHQGSLKLNVITAQIHNSCFYFIEHNWMHEQESYQHNVGKILKFFKLEESKFQVNFGDLPTKYSDKNGNELYLNPSILIDMTSYSELEINMESSCQELVEDFLGMNQCLEKDFLILARLNLSKISLNFLNTNNLLFNLRFSTNSAIRIDFSKGITLDSVLKYLSFSTILNKQSLLQIDEILVSLNIAKNYTSVHISSVNELNLILYNLMPNLNLFFLWNTSLKSFLKHDIDIVIDLSSCSAKLPCIYERKYLTVNFNKIILNLSKKMDFNRKILVVLKNAKLFSPSLDSFYSIKSERIVIESVETHDDHKLQVLFAPIIFSKETNQISISDSKTIYSCAEINSTHSFQSYLYTCNASELIEPNDENDKIFNTNNAIYLIVFQLRFHRFKFKNQTYSYQFEFVLGDIFGSINSFNLSQVMSLASNFWEYFQFEKDAYIFILNNAILDRLSYVSVRVITSLTQLNVLKNSNDQNEEFFLFNLTISPLNYAFCDFHFGNDTSGTLGSMPDLCLKMFCSVKSEINHVTDTIIVECGTIVVNYLSLIEHEKINEARLKTKIEFLKMNDSETKRLYFLWNFDQDECGCRGNALFFSNSNEIHMLYDFDKDHIVKPCIYDISSNADKYGFGQSIIIPNEMTFFSYRSFNDDKTSMKISPGQEFIVLANLENDEPLSKPKYDPFQIIVYENELNKFNNESLSFDFLNKLNAENLNYNSASMTPPYFANEFSIYIRYLPVIRNVAKVTHTPRKNNFKIVLKDTQANIPYSDLKDGLALWNKLKTRRNAIEKIELPNQLKTMTYKNKEVSKKLITKQKLKQLQKLNNNNNNNDYGLLNKSKVKLKKTSATFPAKMTENLSPYYLNFLPILNLNLVQIRNGFKLESRVTKRKKICVHEVFLQCFLNAYQTKFLEENLKQPIFEKVNLALNEDSSANEGFLLNQNKNLMNIKNVTVIVTPIIMDRMQTFNELGQLKGNQDLPLNLDENGFEHFDEMLGKYSKNITSINIFFLNSTTVEKKSVNQIVQLSLRNVKIFTCHKLSFSKELYIIVVESIWLNSNVNFHENSTEKFLSNESYMEFWKSFLQPCVQFNLIKFYFKIIIKHLIVSHPDSSQINIPQIVFYAFSTNQTLNLSLELFDWQIENPFSIFKMFTFAKMIIKAKNYLQMQVKSILNYSFKINFKNIEAKLELNERLDLNMCVKELQIFVSRSNRLEKIKIQTEFKVENSLFSGIY